MCKPGWNLPAWQANGDKHKDESGEDWSKVVKATGRGKKTAKYHPSVFIKTLEMSYRPAGNPKSKLLVHKPESKTDLYYITEDSVIGADLGEETKIVLVKRHQTGAVHGQPICADHLQKLLQKASLRNQQGPQS